MVPFALYFGPGLPFRLTNPKKGCPYDDMVTGLLRTVLLNAIITCNHTGGT